MKKNIKVFIIKSRNTKTGEVKELQRHAFKGYQTAVSCLQEILKLERAELQEAQYDVNTNMAGIIKGFIEVYETRKGSYTEVLIRRPIKKYTYDF